MNRNLRWILPVMLAFAGVALRGAAQQGEALPAETVKKVEDFVAAEMARQKIPGLTLAIGMSGKVVYSKALGMADLENGAAVKASTVFRTASIAKPLTATAVMQLAEAGKLDLDAPIQKYCPAFPEKQWPVTARQLLGHLGGVRHYQTPGEAAGKEHFFTLNDSLRVFKDDPLLHEPGTRYNYSTYGYSVLGCAVEGAAGMPYEQYMAERVFQPAGMSRTQLDNVFAIIPDRARGYQRLEQQAFDSLPAAAKASAKVGEVYNAQLHDTSMKVPGGGLLSTSEDLVRFAFALRGGVLVKPETLKQMWTPQTTSDTKPTAYGLGWAIPPTEQGRLILHTGGQAGTSTIVAIRTDKDIVIALMTNLQGVGTNRLAGQIGAILIGAPQ